MHQRRESRTCEEYFELCNILREFPDKFREYYRMNITRFDYILDSVRDHLQSCSNFRKGIEAEEKLTVAARFVLLIVVKIKRNDRFKKFNAVIILYRVKKNYTRVINDTLNCSNLQIYRHKHKHQ
jgi:hypothetical protein